MGKLAFVLAVMQLWVCQAYAQTITAYSFLQLPSHARLLALGSNNVSEAGTDVQYAFVNPALISDSLAGTASVGYMFYIADIGQATAAYAHTFPRAGTLHFGLRHVNYGSLEGYDDTGMPIGTFRSSDTELLMGKTFHSGNFHLAVNAKAVFSNLAGYRSTALLTDVGGVFVHPNNRLSAGLVFRNLGITITDFTPSANSTLPFDVQLGTTFKPEHMPARFTLTLTRLTRPGRIFNDPLLPSQPSALKKAFTHLTLGTEVFLNKHVSLLAGFNALRQYELGRGFSGGLSVGVKNFAFVVSHTTYSLQTGTWAFTLSSNMQTLWKVKHL